MKFDHTVKFNGIWYNAGEEIPSPVSNVKTEPIVEEKKTEVVVEQPGETKYTKTQIMRLSTFDLKALASSLGLINDGDEHSGAELKKLIVAHMGL